MSIRARTVIHPVSREEFHLAPSATVDIYIVYDAAGIEYGRIRKTVTRSLQAPTHTRYEDVRSGFASESVQGVLARVVPVKPTSALPPAGKAPGTYWTR